MKNKNITIFGYGSLLNMDSLKKTLPDVSDVRVATLKGFRRVFNLRAKRIISKCGPVAVLDIENNPEAEINGVYFRVNEDELKELKKREILYDFIEIDVENEKGELVKALTVQAKGRPRTDYKLNCELQKKYYDVCIKGAESLGNKFYHLYLETTYIDNKNLVQFLKE